jgi:hypothetical protein
MKKSILALAIIVSFASCKKTETTEFVATDVTGTMVLKGNLSRNIVTPSGNGGWTTNAKIPVRGQGIAVKINKNALYPNSNTQGADIYYGVSDSLGNYNVTVRTNANGVNAQITFDGFNATLDTLVNGIVKKGSYASYASANLNRTLILGQNSTLDYTYNASTLVSNPNNNSKLGTAVITGFVYVNTLKQVLTGTLTTLTTTNVALANHKVYLNFFNDPNSLTSKSYQTTTDGNGAYSFTVNTVESGTPNFGSQYADVWVNDFASTRDTLSTNNTVKTGKGGVFHKQSTSESSIYNGTIRNAVNFTYSSFTQN